MAWVEVDSNLIPQTSLHLLIVEDTPADAELLVMTLETAGVTFSYDTADAAPQCQNLLQQYRYDAVLSDYRLPGFTGQQVLQWLHQSGQQIPLILVTGNLGEEAAVECIKAGMTDYVLKDRLFRLPMVLGRSLQEYNLRQQRQAAVAQLRQQAHREWFLNQMSRTLNSSLNPSDILQKIVHLTGECFEVDRVVLFSAQADQFRVLTEWRLNQQVVPLQGHDYSLATGFSSLPLVTPLAYCPIHAPNFSAMPHSLQRLQAIERAQVQSILQVPIWIHDTLFGGIALHTTLHQRCFTDAEIHLLKGIADHAAMALYNAQSYERLEQLVQERTQELEQAKLLAESANRAKSEFLAGVSHELRTPLSGILSLCQVLQQPFLGPLTPKQQQYVATIFNSGQHLLELINDLQDLGVVEAGRESLNLQPLLVEKICQTCLSLVRERARNRGLDVLLQIDPGVTTCVADERRLKQILFNLLANAVKFTESGSITLAVVSHSDSIEFRVVDTGIGIAEADQALIFEPFQQLNSRLKHSTEGTGLGLALARHLARLHGGDLTVFSIPERGSCFTVTLDQQLVTSNLPTSSIT